MKVDNSQIVGFQDYFQRRGDEFLALTQRLVETESQSGDDAGSRRVVDLLVEAAATIPDLKTVRTPRASYGEHLRVSAFERSGSKPIVLLGHTDTVHPRGSLAERPWRIENQKAFGPGVFDMKANCALALEVIRCLVNLNIQPNRPIVLLLTCDEETGSQSGRKLVEHEAANAEAVLVLEPPAPGGRAKTGRKGTGIFTLKAQGRAAHAGLEPEKGASAILELARQTVHLHELNGSSGISINVGVIQGGTFSNVVPAQAQAEIDVRFSTAEEAIEIENKTRGLKAFDERVSLSITGGINRPPLERSEKVVELYRKARAVAAQLSFDLGETQVGGASDGNFAAATGAAVLDGLGIDGDGAHATYEHILIDDVARRGAWLAELITTL